MVKKSPFHIYVGNAFNSVATVYQQSHQRRECEAVAENHETPIKTKLKESRGR